MRKIAVVCEGSGGLEDIVASKFARAPKIVFVELEDEGRILDVKAIDNPGANAESGAAVKIIQTVIDEGAEAVVAPAFGPNAQAILDEVKVKGITVPAGTKVREAVEIAKRELGI
ncbi:NifB/NifX family molybdenum-iron cluster-binding protein [Fervidicoccus fontis]|nr:NifB/NifX family molybdenum-iron cluster-binding protein [Fervidicoccus fontis]MBE9391253.1 NifB/NifX family molybdenum-iron cluster-binding protein [Fervidicoccus fontis]